MSEPNNINQHIQDTESAATTATGDAVIYVYNYNYNYKDVKDKPVDSDKAAATDEILSCPYRGLFSFSPNDAKFFFGRDVFIEKLFQATKTNNFIPVLGASGSGKSSVVLAGLVPKLEQEGNWKFTHFRPGDEPFHALAKALLPLYMPELNRMNRSEKSRDLAAKLAQGSFPLKDVFDDIESNYPNHKLLLIADQFEELFTLCPEDKIRHSFLDLLLACFQSSPNNLQSPPVLVTTMRADFLGKALAYRPLADVLSSDIKLGAMNREELSDVVVKPAELLGVEFEAGLADRILDDVENEPGNLALLEFALTELWAEQTGNQLTHQAYENIGKVEGALAKYAEQKYQELKKNEQEQARQMFIKLVNPGEDNNDTRRRVNREQIGDNDWDLVTRKHGLADNRLVVTSLSSDERETLEVVHEALIRHWSRLKGWLNEDRENLKKQRQIEDTAQDWQASGKKTGYLLRKKRLKEAKNFQKEQQEEYPLSELAVSFFAESIKHQRRERIKSWGLFLIIPLIGTIIGGYFVVKEISLNADKNLIRDCGGRVACDGRKKALSTLVEAKRRINIYDLEDIDLRGAFLEGANLSNADLNSTDLSNAKLFSANLEDANLEDANLSNADLEDANLEDADLRSANLFSADLNGANLNGADLNGADLRSANLNGANLNGADLRSANLNGANLNGADLRSANLNGADLNRAGLNDADLRSANLIESENLTPFQIKLACYWKEAFYKGNFDLEKKQWIIDKTANQEYIEELKQDKTSNPKEPVDCSRWEEK